ARAACVFFLVGGRLHPPPRWGRGGGRGGRGGGGGAAPPHTPDEIEHGIEQDITEAARDLTGRMLEDLGALLTSTDPIASTPGPDVTGPAGW
ncbi:hypothetical protein ACFXAF_05105, partial [Kitasatospora sp. NPDC059463]